MAVENRYISVAYNMYVRDCDTDSQDEELVERCEVKHPFSFISNLGLTLPAFEAGVVDKERGERFSFVIPCRDAYGDFCDELMFDVEKSIFMVDDKFDTEHIYEGAVVPMRNEDGNMFNATIIEIKDDAVTIDLNHPRAGQDLHFMGIVVENRVATNEEISEMLNAMSEECEGNCGGCGGCGSNGGCGGGCHSGK